MNRSVAVRPRAAPPPPPGQRGLRLALLGLRAGPVVVLAVLVLVLGAASPVFWSLENVGNVLNQSAVICVLALGQLLVVLTRGIDLSVGSNLSLCAVVGALVWRDVGSTTAAVLAALATGALVGLVNGLLYVKGRLPHPFIATLATLAAASGLALYLSGSQTVRGVPPVVREVGGGRIAAVPGGGDIGWFPTAALVVIAVALLTTCVLRGLVWGRWIYAVGGNPEAAVRTGIPVPAVLISVYVACGLLAGVAALLMAGRGGAGSPMSGSLAELDAIAAVIIGGASFLGGRGSVLNALTGALVIAVMRNGLNLLGIDPNWQYMATGVVIVLAVELDVARGHVERRFRGMQAVGAAMTGVLQVRDAAKRFGAVVALDGVSLEVARGEVLALLGDNGAGKSTLIKAISGVHRLDSGSITLDGTDVTTAGAMAVRAHGVETVYQDLALFDNLDPAANFFAGRELAGPAWLPRALRLMRHGRMTERTRELLDRLRVDLPDLDAPVALMSGGQRQAVAVARAVAFSSTLVVLDEPTAALGLRETAGVLDLIRRLKADGIAVILISHSMDQVAAVADRAMVLRRGRCVGECVPTPDNHPQLVAWIVGAAGTATI